MGMIEVGSDFSGVGAFDQALRRNNIDYKTVFSCDMDKYARQTYIHNYGEPDYYPENVYDREIPSESLDIYMTSPPCQSFSLAGKRKGKDSENGVLFFNSHEFIKHNKPRFFIFENVKGLLSDDGGKTFSEWCNMLGGKSINGLPILFPYEDSVPYHIYHKVLNAKKYGVPQNRERVFIIGIRDDSDNLFRWPKEEPLTKKLADVLESDVDEKYFLSEKTLSWIIGHREKRGSGNQFPMDENQHSQCITSRYHKCGAEYPYIKVKPSNKVIAGRMIGRNPDNPKSRKSGEHRVQMIEENENPNITNTITTVQKDNLVISDRIRRLTPRECFRLMDFPNSFTWPVSDTQAYKQAGNSIVVAVLAKIINKFTK
jgi:DNA (cytosine-5)-methyltransferase 1